MFQELGLKLDKCFAPIVIRLTPKRESDEFQGQSLYKKVLNSNTFTKVGTVSINKRGGMIMDVPLNEEVPKYYKTLIYELGWWVKRINGFEPIDITQKVVEEVCNTNRKEGFGVTGFINEDGKVVYYMQYTEY